MQRFVGIIGLVSVASASTYDLNCLSVDPRSTDYWCQENCITKGKFNDHPACFIDYEDKSVHTVCQCLNGLKEEEHHKNPMLKAQFKNKETLGSVYLLPFKNNDIEGYEWKVDLKLLNPESSLYDACRSDDNKYIELGWHIHERRSESDFGDVGGEACGPGPIGGHYDPTFACGPATEQRESCDLLGRTRASNQYTCNPYFYAQSPYVCEAGDLGGKFGNLRFDLKTMKYQ
eukprot:Awhi_evm1s3668